MADRQQCTLGTFLASRLVEVGVSHIFGVPGDFNLTLLDQFVDYKRLETIWTCNELNAGYAADGFCRRNGVGACVFTYCVGGLSIINACAGCHSEDLPVIFISGGPNSNDFSANHVIHHTIGSTDLTQQYRAFKEVTCAAVVVQHLTEAHHQIDYAISEALKHRKPVYIEICCNLAGLKHPSFGDPPIPFQVSFAKTNDSSLAEAVKATIKVLSTAVKPVLLGGPRIRAWKRSDAFRQLADALDCAVAVTADAKGMFPEDHPNYIGHYWGSISAEGCNETVEGADVVIAVGFVRTDYSTLGYSLLLKPNKLIDIDNRHVTVMGGETFGCIEMEDYMRALAQAVTPNNASIRNFRRMVPVPKEGLKHAPTLNENEPLTTNNMIRRLQEVVTADTCILAETGDSWFNGLKLKLPPGAGFEVQMRYGSIGWSVGATLGYSLAAMRDEKRLISMIGDGSFQMTAQDVSTMIRYQANPIILLINNKGYTIEIEIHDGPYNIIQNWDYTKLVESMWNGKGKLFTAKVNTEPELVTALHRAIEEKKDHVCFIELQIDTHDCSKELLEFGARVANANSRAPHAQNMLH